MKKINILIIAIALFTNSLYAQWQLTSLPQSSYISCITSTSTRVFAGTWTEYGLCKSDDNGTTWSPTSLNYPITWLYVNGTDLYAATSGFGLYISSDNGDTWSLINTGLTNKTVYSIAAIGSTLFVVTDFYGAFRSNDGGISWSAINNGLPYDTSYNRYYFGSTMVTCGNTLFVGTFNGIYRSTDNGDSWTAVNTGVDMVFPKIYIMSANENKIYAGSWGGGVYVSSNNGDSWTAINNGLEATNKKINALTVSGTHVFAGTGNNGLYTITTDGTSWKNITSNMPSYLVNSIAVIGTDIFTGVGGNSNTYLWKRPISEITGVKNISSDNAFSVYPNPVKDKLTIRSSSSANILNYEVLSLDGKSILKTGIGEKANIDVSDLQRGIYMLKVNLKDGIMVSKFIKE